MYNLRANIQLSNKYRKSDIKGNEYRPLLHFSDKIIRSGLIDLEYRDKLEMNKSYKNILFKIYFYLDLDCSLEFQIGRKFKIAEGSTIIGYGEIVENIGEVSAE
jgi:hypothetical protein